jgi:type I restriction enzyme R subunit
MSESEWKTRKRRIDPRLDACGWHLPKGSTTPIHRPYRTEEEETDNGPADYALWLDNHVVGVVEAKKLTVGPQGVLPQVERYARGTTSPPNGSSAMDWATSISRRTTSWPSRNS